MTFTMGVPYCNDVIVTGNNNAVVLAVDDHPLIRMGVRGVVMGCDFGKKITFLEAGEADEMANVLKKKGEPDLLILDLNVPSYEGIDLLRYALKLTKAPVIVYSLHDELVSGGCCLRAGAKAYVMKEADPTQLENALCTVMDGGLWCSPKLAAHIAKGEPSVAGLTKRELLVYEELGRGKSVKEIGYDLEVSPKTVESYRDRIRQKLEVGSSAELVVHATRWLKGV